PAGEPADEGRREAERFTPADLCANTRELGLGGTSPVGIFPHGAAACGAEELAGNVWEWCASRYYEYPLPEELAAETLDTSSGIRTYVLRGGSWLFNRASARCGARNLHYPGTLVDLGFRVARLFSLGSS